MDKETFLKYESKAAKLFTNSRRMNRLSSAYLLYGNRNAPLKDCALYLAESLNCENDLLACKTCLSCKKFENNIRPDFVFIDGQNQLIKKEDIQTLENKFALSALEKNKRLCYVINIVENITEIAANSILKFLEEPKEGQVAILTTYNLDKVLPTIRSRSIEVRIDALDSHALYNKLQDTPILIDKGKKQEQLPLTDGECYMLTKFFSSFDEIKETLTTDNSFLEGYLCAEMFFTALVSDKKEAGYTLLKQTSLKKPSSCYNWMYLIIHEIFSNALLEKNEELNPFKDTIKTLSKDKLKIEKADKIVKEALTFKNINFNQIALSARLALTLIK